MRKKRVSLPLLFLTMLKIGAFTFGGGYAMIALLENEFISKNGWIDKDEFLSMVAIAESTPGPIAINSATYIGYKLFGVLGSLTATLGVVMPSFFIIYIISIFFDEFLSMPIVFAAFNGIRVCVIYLILSAGIRLFRGQKKNAFFYCVFIAVFLLMSFLSLSGRSFSSVFYILFSGVAGLVYSGITNCKKEEEK